MNGNFILDFGKIVSEMREKNIQLLLVKNRRWFVMDANNCLFEMERYWDQTYLDKLIGQGRIIAFQKCSDELSKMTLSLDKEIWDIERVQQFIDKVVSVEYPAINRAGVPVQEQNPECRFNLGDKVKIPYISDCDSRNNQVGEVTGIRRQKFYPGGDVNNLVWKYQMQITYPDGQSITVDPNRKGSGLISEVVLVEPKTTNLSLDAQIQSAASRSSDVSADFGKKICHNGPGER